MIYTTYDGSLNFDTKINTDGFSKGANTIKSQANGLKSVLSGLGRAMIAAFSITALVTFGKQAIDIASDLTEVQNVVDTAFGNMSYKIEDFADKAIDNFGLSELSAKQMASTYMAMSTGMGQVASTASDMAVEITGRLGDVMSFYNLAQSEADTVGRAVYSGETEPLKRLGIVMTQTNLKAFAMAKGFKTAYDEMSAGDQLLVRQQYFLEQTNLAAGDFVKTSGSWANQTRVLSERWKEFLGIIGNGLIQVLAPVVQFINTALSYMISFATAAGNALSSVFGLSTATASTAQNMAAIAANSADASTGLSDMGDSAKKASKDANKSLSGIDKLNNRTESVASNSENAAGALSGIGAGGIGTYGATVKVDTDTSPLETGLKNALGNIKSLLSAFNSWIATNFAPIFANIWTNLHGPIATFKEIASGIFTDIKSLGQPLIDYFNGSFTTYLKQAFTTLGVIAVGMFDTFNMVFSDIWNIAVFPIIKQFITTMLPMLTDLGTQVWKLLEVIFISFKTIFDMIWRDAIAPALKLATKIWIDYINTIKSFWDKWGVPIFDGIKEAWRTTTELFQTLWKTILKPVWDAFMKVADKLWADHLQPLLVNFLDFVGEFATGALAIYNKFIAPVLKWFVETFGPPIVKVITGLITNFGNFLGSIIDSVSGIITALKGIVQFITGVFTGDWKKAWTGVKTIFKGIFDALVPIVRAPVNLIIDIINGMISGIVSGINTVINAANALSFKAPEWLGGKTYGVQIKNITAPKIPKLATGTVIPPNSEFMAILGDQKKGVNIEAPLDTIVEAFKAVVGQGSGNGMVNLNVYLSGKQIYSEIVKQDNDYRNQNGGNSAFA